jgi:hypothetical protein
MKICTRAVALVFRAAGLLKFRQWMRSIPRDQVLALTRRSLGQFGGCHNPFVFPALTTVNWLVRRSA